jgi:hypothetical protein
VKLAYTFMMLAKASNVAGLVDMCRNNIAFEVHTTLLQLCSCSMFFERIPAARIEPIDAAGHCVP